MTDDGERNKLSCSVSVPVWVLLASLHGFRDHLHCEFLLPTPTACRSYKCINKSIGLLAPEVTAGFAGSTGPVFSVSNPVVSSLKVSWWGGPAQIQQHVRNSPGGVGSCTSVACRLSTGSKSASSSFVVPSNCWITSLNYFQSISLIWKAHRKLIMFKIRQIRILTR